MFLAVLLAAVAPALTADQIVARHVAAVGGAEALAAVQSLRIDGTAVFGDADFAIKAAFSQVSKRPGSVRREITIQGLTAIDAYDGAESWSVNPFQGRRDPFRTSADEAKGLWEDAAFAGPLATAKERGSKVELLGTEDVDGTPAYKLRVTFRNGDDQTVFLDPDSFLEIRRLTRRIVRGSEQVTESDLGGYVKVGGIWIAGSIESGRKGGPRDFKVTIESAQANGAAGDELFRFPSQKPSRELVPPEHPAPLSAEAPPAAKGQQPVFDSGTVSGLGARNIGSAAMSGRIAAVAAYVDAGRTVLYVGAASGGVWKSMDGGTTFKPVFDKEPVQSIGAIAVDPTNHDVVWVGTGEAWTRNSVSVGDGVYKSTDGGETWTNVGLPKSERVARIVVHPKDGNTVYACVPGALWSDSPDRGLYKSTDGGRSWDLILTGPNMSTGCSSVAMDPRDPNVLYSALWDFRREGWTFRSGGEGPAAPSGSAFYKSTDGGASWTEIKDVTPKPYGRIEIAVAPSNGDVVYAFIESTASSLWRSADAGRTWQKRDDSQWMNWRPFYFARMVVDPSNPDRLFKMDGALIASDDGGKSFATVAGFGTNHGDWHDLWFEPGNPKHIVGGNDGGLFTSWDGGNRWIKSENLPVSQFYHVAVDDKDPYSVYGGLQDNSAWVGDSAYGGGISNSRWENLLGGDGMWVIPDPTDADGVYAESQGGFVSRVDRKLQIARDIQPKAAYHEKLRFNWNTPLVPSPTQKGTIYLGSQFLFRSRDKGQTWERISPDLTTNDPQKQRQEESGGVTVDNSSAEMHTTIYSISESPLDANEIWVGTDDGNVQLTRDGGKHWSDLTRSFPRLPRGEWVSWVEASRFDKGVAYAAFDRHMWGDLTPWVFRTTDFGKTWTRIVSPAQGVRGYAHVIREDAVARGLLFCGTEFGLWISIDAGRSWAQFKGGDFPAVAVRDLAIQQRDDDLVLATHGRGIWIIDDLTPLRAMSAQVMTKDVAFLPARPAQQRLQQQGGWSEGDATFFGQNPTPGVPITYYQRTRHLYGPLKLEVLDDKGEVIDTIPATKHRGINRVAWSMKVKPPRVPRAAQAAFAATQGPRVVPGTYTARLTRGAQVIETKIVVGLDRRAPWDLAGRKEHFDAAMKVHGLFGAMSDLVDRIDGARMAAQAKLKADAKDAAAAGLVEKLDRMKREIVATKEGGAITGEERIREHADHLYGALLSWEGKPAGYLLDRTEALSRELADVKKEFEALGAQGHARAPMPESDRATVATCLLAQWEACGARGMEESAAR